MSMQGDNRSDPMDYPSVKIVVGAIILFAAYWLSGIFNELETGVRESYRIHWLVALLYNTFGPFVTIVVVVVLGLALLSWGLFQLFNKKDG